MWEKTRKIAIIVKRNRLWRGREGVLRGEEGREMKAGKLAALIYCNAALGIV